MHGAVGSRVHRRRGAALCRWNQYSRRVGRLALVDREGRWLEQPLSASLVVRRQCDDRDSPDLSRFMFCLLLLPGFPFSSLTMDQRPHAGGLEISSSSRDHLYLSGIAGSDGKQRDLINFQYLAAAGLSMSAQHPVSGCGLRIGRYHRGGFRHAVQLQTTALQCLSLWNLFDAREVGSQIRTCCIPERWQDEYKSLSIRLRFLKESSPH